MRKTVSALAGLSVAALVPAASLAAQQTQTYRLQDSRAAIYNLVGDVTVQPTSASTVVVEMTRGGSDAGELRVERGDVAGTAALRVIYPGDRIVYPAFGDDSQTELRVRDDGTFGDGHGRHRSDEGRRVTIAGSGGGLEAYANLTIGVPEGGTLELRQAVGSVTIRNVRGDLEVNTASARVAVDGTRGALSVDVGSGDIRVTGAQGEISLDTGSGDVTISGTSGADLGIDTGSGSVSVADVTVTGLFVDTGSGDITISAVRASRASLDAGSGSVNAQFSSDLADLSIDTGSGDVTVRAPASLGAEVAIETGSGEIESGFPIAVTRRAPDELVGRIGDGSGTLAIDTGSGNVRLVPR